MLIVGRRLCLQYNVEVHYYFFFYMKIPTKSNVQISKSLIKVIAEVLTVKMSVHADEYLSDAREFATRATVFDQQHMLSAAIYYYKAAADCLRLAMQFGPNAAFYQEKVDEYMNRAKELQKIEDRHAVLSVQKNTQQSQLERAEFLLLHGLEADEADQKKEAIELYTEAVELCLSARKSVSDGNLKEKLRKVATHALDRIELLKTKEMQPSVTATSSPQSSVRFDSVNKTQSAHVGLQSKGKELYTKEEIGVLRVSSLINGREFVPFMSCDLNERFAYPLPFDDSHGKLSLSPKQKPVFRKWARLEDLSSSPKIIELIDCFSICQTVVSDCSFIASLAVCSLHEKKTKKQLISNIIFPQNRAGYPVYNPCGKYMVKLNVNGVQRKVVIDDYLPVDSSNRLLCSYSKNRNEFWVSLLEKAYMKLMGGYDFPGSNSNIDLHALTGWIPERISMEDPSFDRDKIFNTLLTHHKAADVLITLATGDLKEDEAERSGLVPAHAYAVLDIQHVLGQKLFLVKNPWSHLRWKGKFSEHDTKNWTPKLREALKYDPHNAQMFDNGVFWIDYASVCHFYNVMYLNWNPKLFPYTYSTHQCWKAGAGPVKDVFNIGENPQFSLELKSTGASVWILLTRHITDRDDFADNQEYIAVLAYKNNGQKVYFPYEPEPFIDGLRINSPHYLCKIIVPQDGVTRYTLVISQYEKTNTIYYTLKAYSTCQFTLTKIINTFKYKHEIKNGEWNDATAGGCINNPLTYNMNPIYQMTLQSSSDDNHLLIDLKGPKQFKVGFDIVTVSVNNPSSPNYFERKTSGLYRSGFTLLELHKVPSGMYNIIPSTFYPGQKGPFFITFQSTCPLSIKHLK